MPDIAGLASQLMERELTKNPDQFKTIQRSVDRSEPGMSPHTLATLGGIMDAASTYAFMKRGTAKEGNPLVNALGRGNPELTGLTAIGGLLATKGATHLLGKKWPKVAEIIAANLGAEQMGLGAHNMAKAFGQEHSGADTAREYHNVLGRNTMRTASKVN